MSNTPAYLIGAVLIVGITGHRIWKLRRWIERQEWLVSLGRFLSGWRADGRGGRARRAGIRSGGTLAVLLLVATWLASPQAAAAIAGGLAISGLVLSIALSCRWVLLFRHRRTWLRPAHLAAHQVAQIDARRPPQEWLTVAPDRSRAVAALPAGWGGDDGDRQRLAAILTAKLGMESPDPAWHLAGPRPTLTLTVAKPPPPEVSLAQLMPFIGAARADEVICGLGIASAPVGIDLDSDSPHIGLTMGSGGGKSITSRLILAQLLYKGCVGLVLDAKRISHAWSRGLPNVAYCREIEEIHEALLWLEAECDRRNRVADASVDIEGRVHGKVGPRIIVIAEELNTLMKRLRAYWAQVRGPGDRARSPALDALDAVLSMGRQVLMNVVMIGQRLSAAATGGGDARENLAALIFARFKPSTWKMLVPDMPMPARTTHKLRAWTVTDSVRAVQVALLTGREARDLALAGTVEVLASRYPGCPGVTGYGHESIPGSDLGSVTQQPGIPPIAPPPVTGLVTVREAIRVGLLPEGTTPEAVKQAAYRDRLRPEPERVFPVHRGMRGLAKVYDAAELEDWGAARR